MKTALKRIVKNDFLTIAGEIDPGVLIMDRNGKTFHSGASRDESCPVAGKCSGKHPGRYPIEIKGKTIGWVSGREKAPAIALLLSYLAQKEMEKKALARETLEKYKEINVFYDVTEKLAATLDPKQAALLVLEEAQRLIAADNISVLVLNNETCVCKTLAVKGRDIYQGTPVRPGKGIAGNILISGKAEIVNDVLSDRRLIEGNIKISSLMCAPMKIKDKIIGILNISSTDAKNYTAGDLKILSALAMQAAVAIENARLYDSLKEAFLTIVSTLAETIEKKDQYTGGHTRRVMTYSMAIGESLNLPAPDLEKLKLAAMLHDIGKIGVPDRVLLKKGNLDNEEYGMIKMHTVYGEELLSHIKYFQDIIHGVKQHHERYDGKGYPEGLQGKSIDYIARIIAIADTYDAMTTDRPYRKALSHETAMEEIKNNAGSQFDPELVEAILKIDLRNFKE